jgi:hypothetical protein
MQELLKISYEAENPTVSARELHDQLNIGTKFTTWFQRMTEYGFSENTDYKTCYPNLGSENHGGQNMVDYQISVDMAKEICMIQRSPEGKRIRQYFIDLEKACMEHTGTDICQGIKDGRQDYRRTEAQ